MSEAVKQVKAEVKERPIIFSGPMVRAILEGRKTQTRRVVKPQPESDITIACEDGGGNWVFWSGAVSQDMTAFTKAAYPNGEGYPCPYGRIGDCLWVRETFWPRPFRTPRDMREGADTWPSIIYDADEPDAEQLKGWGWKRKSPLFLPRESARVVLRITSVRAERLREITEEDAKAEGMLKAGVGGRRLTFSVGWDKINGKRKGCTWSDSPFVWVIEFKKP